MPLEAKAANRNLGEYAAQSKIAKGEMTDVPRPSMGEELSNGDTALATSIDDTLMATAERMREERNRRNITERRATEGSPPVGTAERRLNQRRRTIEEIQRLKGVKEAAANPGPRDTHQYNVGTIDRRIDKLRSKIGATEAPVLDNFTHSIAPSSSTAPQLVSETNAVGNLANVALEKGFHVSRSMGKAGAALTGLAAVQGAATAYEEAQAAPSEERMSIYKSNAKLQAGLGAGLAIAHKVAPATLGALGRYAAAPLGVATAGYDTVRTANAYFDWQDAANNAKVEKQLSDIKYGDVGKATATRRREDAKKANRKPVPEWMNTSVLSSEDL